MSRDLTRAAAHLVDATVARLEAQLEAQGDIGRRRFLVRGATSLAALLAGAALGACDSQGPQAAQRLLRFAERRNEGVERWLTRQTSVDRARDGAATAGTRFPSYHIARLAPTWDEAARGPWALEIAGLVQRPQRFTLDQLLRLPQTQQRVNHYCVEGWNAVATFWGVRLRELARLAGPLPQAQYVDFESFDRDARTNVAFHESWDLESAVHPQTLVVYAKDGRYLDAAYGAPARVHSPVKLGYKNAKYLTRIVFRAERNGGYWSDMGYEWYGGT